MKKERILLFIILAFMCTSCHKTQDPGATAAVKMANEWWVTFKLGGVDQYGTHVKIKTYNTSSNGNEIWIDDFPVGANGNVWGFQVKAQADFNALTFSATKSPSAVPGYNIKIDVTNGKIFPNLGRSKSGNVVDSIYMKIRFEDDPTNTYELSGHARTRFVEDDY
jgi:hypothetical protein